MEKNRVSASKDVPFVSILVVNYNGKVHFEEFFSSILNLEYPKDKYEVVVIDNASSDGSVEYIRDKYPTIIVIELDKNYGFAEGNNIGAKYCKGKFIALINNDTVLDKHWLSELMKNAVSDPNSIYSSKMLWYVKKDFIVYHGGVYLAWGWPFHLKGLEKDNKNEIKTTLSVYADGCGMLISKNLFFELGGFDTSYFAYAEDYELSWKAWLLGYKIYFVPTSRFYHKVSSTLGRASTKYIYFLWRNQLRNIIKFTELNTLLFMLPLFILNSLAVYSMLFFEGYYLIFIPMLRAYYKVSLELPSLIKIRKKIQSTRIVKDNDLRKLGLILPLKESIMESISLIKRRKRFWKEVIK